MKKILHVISSACGEASDSIRLGNRIIEKLQQRYEGSTATVVNVLERDYAPLSQLHIDAYKTPPAQQTPEHKQALRNSETAIKEVMDADVIIISTPLYNFTVPAALKAWVDHIVRAGVTFSYGSEGPKGLITNKKVYLAIASNGVYSEGPMKAFDYAEPYLRFILSFIGMTDITTYRIEGSGISGVMETAVQKGLASVEV